MLNLNLQLKPRILNSLSTLPGVLRYPLISQHMQMAPYSPGFLSAPIQSISCPSSSLQPLEILLHRFQSPQVSSNLTNTISVVFFAQVKIRSYPKSWFSLPSYPISHELTYFASFPSLSLQRKPPLSFPWPSEYHSWSSGFLPYPSDNPLSKHNSQHPLAVV